MRRALCIALMLAAVTLPARADLHEDMRARFLLYPPVCSGNVECVLHRMKSWFGREFEARTFSGGVTNVYLVRRDADGRLVEVQLVGEM